MADDGTDTARLRDALNAAGRRLGARGLISAGEGNLSIRLPGERLLVTPTGDRKDELTPDRILIVPLDPALPEDPSNAPGLRPSSDIAIHRALHRARPDVMAVAHAHLPASMALTLAGEVPDPGALPETAYHLPRLPMVPFGAMGSEPLARGIVAALTEPPEPLPVAAILERHGAVAIGTGDPAEALAAAVSRLELVEVLCRTWRDALLVRAARRSVGTGG